MTPRSSAVVMVSLGLIAAFPGGASLPHPRTSTGSLGRGLPRVRHLFSNNAHRYSGYPAYDFSLSRVVKAPNILAGVGVRNYDQLAPIYLAPTAYIPSSQFHEVDGTVEFCLPFFTADLPLACVNLHKRTGADQREERVVFETNIAVHGLAQVQMLQESDGNLVPPLHDSRKEIRFLQAEVWLELHWQRHLLNLQVRSTIEEMRFRNSNGHAIATQVA